MGSVVKGITKFGKNIGLGLGLLKAEADDETAAGLSVLRGRYTREMGISTMYQRQQRQEQVDQSRMIGGQAREIAAADRVRRSIMRRGGARGMTQFGATGDIGVQ